MTTHLDNFRHLRDGADSPDWLRNLQNKAWERLENSRFPTVRDEEWKYTSVRSLQETLFHPLRRDGLPTDGISLIESHLSPDAVKIVFVDGLLSPTYSSNPSDNFTVCELSQIISEAKVREKLVGNGQTEDIFELLSMACFRSGVYIHIPAHQSNLPKIQIVYYSSEASQPTADFVKNLIVVDDSSSVVLEEVFLSPDAAVNFRHFDTKVWLGKNAELKYYRIQRDGLASTLIDRTRIYQERDSKVRFFQFDCGGKLVRHDLDIGITGSGCEVVMNGLYATRGNQHIDNHTVVDHQKPASSSRQFYKGLLNDASRGVFNGKVFVRPHSSQTDAYQLNKNLLLSKEAEIDTKPELQIDNEDVKCTHGATIGHLSEEEEFYCLSRGIPKDIARDLLCHGFANDVLVTVTEAETRKRMGKILEERYFTYR